MHFQWVGIIGLASLAMSVLRSKICLLKYKSVHALLVSAPSLWSHAETAEEFSMQVWKFRSMTVCEDGPNVKQAQKNDSRLTPIGGFRSSEPV